MEKIDLLKQFAERLRSAMIAAGYSSSRSTSGVDIHQLAEMTGYSTQICRKYLRGEAIPEPSKLAEIAEQLQVSPGWLLFGDCHSDGQTTEQKITISKDLLYYIFAHVHELLNPQQSSSELPQFLLTLTTDISQINITDEQSKKMVDLALLAMKQGRS